MKNKGCIFCKIAAKELPSKVIAENEDIIVIQDIHPKAPVHYLIIPKKHIKNIQEMEYPDAICIGQMMLMAKELSENLSGSKAFRLIMNNGADAGQSVFHLHCHFLSGRRMTDF